MHGIMPHTHTHTPACQLDACSHVRSCRSALCSYLLIDPIVYNFACRSFEDDLNGFKFRWLQTANPSHQVITYCITCLGPRVPSSQGIAATYGHSKYTHHTTWKEKKTHKKKNVICICEFKFGRDGVAQHSSDTNVNVIGFPYRYYYFCCQKFMVMSSQRQQLSARPNPLACPALSTTNFYVK